MTKQKKVVEEQAGMSATTNAMKREAKEALEPIWRGLVSLVFSTGCLSKKAEQCADSRLSATQPITL